jgi:hypothetical protein
MDDGSEPIVARGACGDVAALAVRKGSDSGWLVLRYLPITFRAKRCYGRTKAAVVSQQSPSSKSMLDFKEISEMD